MNDAEGSKTPRANLDVSLINHLAIFQSLLEENPSVHIVLWTTNPIFGELQNRDRPNVEQYFDQYRRLVADHPGSYERGIHLLDLNARVWQPGLKGEDIDPEADVPDGLHPTAQFIEQNYRPLFLEKLFEIESIPNKEFSEKSN